jgi:hypothetical protein
MATEPERDDDDDESESWTDDEDEEEEQYNDRALNAARWLYQRTEGEEVDDVEEEEEEEEPTPPPLSYLVEKMMESGITYEQLAKCALLEHNEYDNVFSDEEVHRLTSDIFMGLRTIISNYQAPNPDAVLPIIRGPEAEQLPMPMLSRDNSMIADVKQIRFREPINDILLD